MKLDARLLSSQKYHFFISHETQDLFLKIGAPHKGPDETCYLARSYLELF